MSHIFDALQRSEAESSSTDRSALSEVTELIRHAERREVSKWETKLFPEQTAGSESPSRYTVLDVEEMPTVRSKPNFSDEIASAPTDRHSDLFARCQSLTIALPPQGRLPSVTDSGSPAAEAFRLLGVRLRDLRRERRLKTVLITSTIPQEGKSVITANLACTLSMRTRENTLIVEGDIRRPSLLPLFGTERKPGLCEWLQNQHDIVSSIYHLEGLNTWILPAGHAPSNALELLQSAKLSTLLNRVTGLFDWIIIDSPPVLPLADTSLWMRLADGVLLVTRQGMTEKRKLQRGLEAIEPGKLIGALINSSTNTVASDYYYNSEAD